MKNAHKFTVIGCIESTGQICCHHVIAKDATNAFASAAALDSDLSMIVAMPGWLKEGQALGFPGEGMVDGITVLEQKDVFGEPVFGETEIVEEAAAIVVSLDGGETYHPAREGVRIIYKDVMVDGEDGRGEVHINATHEGLITDIWTTRDEPLDHNIGTDSVSLDDIVSRLVDENS